MFKRFFFWSALAALMLLALAAFAQTQPQPTTVNINEVLAPWRAYYNTRTDWPRSHGYKPFKRYETDLIQRAWPTGQIPVGALWEAYNHRQGMGRQPLDETWVNLGPYNHGGRARVIRWLPGNPNVMFVGSVSGGIFKSTDAGESWGPMTDHLPNLAVGCFEIDPNNPQVMYLGTGEGYYNIDAVGGIGLLKSTDGGNTWNTTGLSYTYGSSQSILRLNLDPRNSQIVLASNAAGLRRSTDGAQTFTMVRSGEIKDLVRDPTNLDVLLCAAGDPWGNTFNGIYRSTDNGVSWTAVNSGLPSVAQIGRIVLAFAPSNSQIAYAGICGTFSFNGSQMIGIYRSTDNGQTWTHMSPDGVNHYASQGWYDMALAVVPADPTMILSAGLDNNRSSNSGASWSRITHWDYNFGDPHYVHADHHEIRFHPTHPNEVWEVTDGGIFKSTDLGTTWVEKNNGFVTFQYYAMGNATLDTVAAYGGTQDNGTFRYAGSPNFEDVFGGDGGYCVVDPTRDSTIYIEYQNGNRYRSDDRGTNFNSINGGIVGDGYWVCPMTLDPFSHLVLYTTTQDGKAWKSTNQGRAGTWTQMGQTISGSMQVMAASSLVPGQVYVGTEGAVFRYDPSADQWTNVTGNLADGWITRVVPDPFVATTVYATVSGFGHGHVFKSLQSGTMWTDISGNLPDVPFQDVIVDPRAPGMLYAGGDIGVYRTTDGGVTWNVFGEGLPAVRVDDMDLQRVTGVLRAATHGRGMWEVPTGGVGFALFYPAGGEVLAPGASLTFLWSGASLGGNVRLEINRSYPSAAWETLFASTPNDGVQDWTVSGAESDHIRFRITHVPGGESDSTRADSRIVLPRVQLVWPNGGDTLLSGVRDTVFFTRLLVPELLRLSLNRYYPDSAWELIAPDVYGDTSTMWAVQLPATSHARLRLESSERPEIFDESAADFVIRMPHMTLNAPNGGESVPAGMVYQVSWSAAEHHDRVRVSLNRDYPTGAWQILTYSTANSGLYNWTPQPPASDHCRIRVSALFDPQTYVESAADFSITSVSVDPNAHLPVAFALSGPEPNPFNPTTRIALDLPSRSRVEARVYNRLGQEAAVLADDMYDTGHYIFTFDGGNLPSGLYFIRLSALGETHILKAVLLK